MATIPLGPGRRVLPQRAPMVQIADTSAPARALQDMGQVGVEFGLRQQARQEAEVEAERRRQEATREAAERARDAVQLQTVEDRLADLHDEIGGQVLRGEVPKSDAEKVWAERSRQVVDEGSSGFSDFGKQTVAGRLTGAAARLGNSVRRTVEKKDREDVTADMGQRLERLQRDYAADPRKAEREASVVFETLGPFSTMSSAQLAQARQKWLEGAQYTAGYEAVSRGRNDAKALADAEKMIGGLEYIDPQKRAVLMDRAAGYRMVQEQKRELAAQRAQREAERLMTRARAEFESFQALADKGGALDPAYVDRVTAATAGTPYQAGVQALAKLAAENGGLAAQPIAVQQATLDAIDARIAQGGRTPELDKRREQVAKVVQGSQADLQRGGLRAALERGVIEQIQPLSMTGGIEGVAQQLQQRVVDAQRAGQWAGAPVSPLTDDEAQQLGRMLSAQPADQRGNGVAMLAAVMPAQQAQALARQIDKQDKPLALALAAGSGMTDKGRTVAELILRGAQAVKDKTIKEDKAAETGLLATLAAEVGDAVPAAAREDVVEAARLIYLGKAASGERVSEAGAVRLAIGGDLVEHNGRRVPVPAGVDLPARLQSYPERLIAQQADDGWVYVGGRPMGVPEFLAGLPSAQLEAAGMGRYAVRAGGVLVTGKHRRPVLVDVR